MKSIFVLFVLFVLILSPELCVLEIKNAQQDHGLSGGDCQGGENIKAGLLATVQPSSANSI